MKRLGVGCSLHPDVEYLETARELIERDADYYEVNPETLWRLKDGRRVRNDYHAMFRTILEKSGKPFVAHGLNFSVGTPVDDTGEPDRIALWLEGLRDDQSAFGFSLISEHLGWTMAGGVPLVFPLPLPHTGEASDVVAARMNLLRSVGPPVAFENWATTFVLDDAASEPEFFNEICRKADCGIMLDLHNVYTQCFNYNLDAAEYVGRLDLKRVLQIHLSGGSISDPSLLKSGRTMRMDSHDGPVPEPVWSLLERVVPRSPNLMGIIVERLNGTFTAAELPALTGELRRAREIFKC
jgi:uncharacterized protein (UPF0276 family)